MRDIFNIFFKVEGASRWRVLLCVLVGSLAEGLSLATLLPLLTMASGTVDDNSLITTLLRQFFETIGVPFRIDALLIFVVVTSMIKSALQLLTMRFIGFSVAEVTTRLRSDLIGKMLKTRWQYFIAQPVGRFANAAAGQASQTGKAYRIVATLIASLIETSVMVVVLIFISWQLTLGAILFGALITLPMRFLIRKAKHAGQVQTRRKRELVVLLTETLGNLKPVKMMGREDIFTSFFEQKIRALRNAIRGVIISQEALPPLQGVMIALVLGVGTYAAVVTLKIDIMTVLVAVIFMMRIAKGIGKIQVIYQTAMLRREPYRELVRLISEVSDAGEANRGSRKPSFERHCRLQSVSFAYGDEDVIDEISMEIPAKGVTVLMGPSGAGKTTIVDLVAGLYRPRRGVVTVDDVPLDEFELQAWRRSIGYVPQELTLFHDTIRANIALGNPDVTDEDVERALELAGAKSFVAGQADGIMTVIGERGAKLSGGQRQRIALARALVGAPKLLILDEVTSALDPEAEQEICDNLKLLSRDIAVLTISHRPTLLSIADRAFRLADGRLHEVSPEASPELKTATLTHSQAS